ncbi:MAG: hypothetical protein ACLU7D_07140 [Collinsella sp.]
MLQRFRMTVRELTAGLQAAWRRNNGPAREIERHSRTRCVWGGSLEVAGDTCFDAGCWTCKPTARVTAIVDGEPTLAFVPAEGRTARAL